MPPSGGTRTELSYRFSSVPQGWGAFSPGLPIQPTINQATRSFDFKPNINSTLRPRAYEPFGFAQLRAFSNVELVRLAIETRKDQIERLDWQIKPVDNVKGKLSDTKLAELTAFWRKPDGATPFATFLRSSMEDLLALDAPALEMRRTRGGQFIGLEIVPGDTIHPMVDDCGRRPRDPSAVAYQQVIKGVAWSDLTNRDLLYLPRNVRPNHMYGFGPVEQIVVTINTIIRRQAAQLSHFTDSNIPAGLLNAPDNWSLDKIVELQQWFDDKIAGNTAEQSKIVWGPAGSKYTAFKDAPIKDDFDEWLARIVAFAFSLPPTPFIRQMNKGTAGEDQDRALEEGLEPYKLWAERWITDVIQTEMGAPEAEFVFVDTPSIDPKVQSEIDDKNLRNGSTTIDEVRDLRGQDPLPDGLGAKPIIYTATGVELLEEAVKPAEQPPAPVVAAAPPATNSEPPSNDNNAAVPKKAAEKLAKAAPISPDRPKARRATASATKALAPIFAKAGDSAAAHVAKELKKIGKAEDDPRVSSDDVANGIAADLDLSELKEIADALNDDLVEIMFDSSELALASVGVKSEKELTNRIFQKAVDYASDRGAELVSVGGDESIIETTRAAIRSIVSKGLNDSETADAIADTIQDNFAFSADRAHLIAETEIATANGQGKAVGWREAQATGLILTKDWFVSEDEGTCEICTGNADAGDVPLDDPFPSGDDFEPAHPRCRCVTSAKATEASDDKDDDQ